jgi:hypothetical protein
MPLPSNLAVECAAQIANYCLTRFPCDSPPHPMLDIPWFAEKVQRCIDDACRIGLDLKQQLEKADAEIGRLRAENAGLLAACSRSLVFLENLRVPQTTEQAGAQIVLGIPVLESLRGAIARAAQQED